MRRMRRRVIAIAATVTLVSLHACEEDRALASHGVPGTLIVRLETPTGVGVGGVTITVGGTELGTPKSADRRYQVFIEGVTPSSATIAIVGQAVSGPLVQVDVPDISDLNGYNVSLIEIVDARNELLASHEGYRLVIEAATATRTANAERSEQPAALWP